MTQGKSVTQVRQQVTLTKKKSGVAILLLDCPGRSNVLNASVLEELEAAVDHAAADDDIKAVVFMSGKADTFLSGADLGEVRRFADAAAAMKLCRMGQAMLNKSRNLQKPLVAAINGACLGGGVELILSSHKRIATNDQITVFAMPEVRLGLIPGLGGTQRLSRLLGPKTALEVILGSEPFDSSRALEIGLIDEIVASDELMARGEELALELAGGGLNALKPLVAKTEELPADYNADKVKTLFAITERSLRITTKGHYPAPPKAVEVMKDGLAQGMAAGLEMEAKAFAELCTSETTHNLMSIMLAAEFYKASALSQSKKSALPPIATVGVVGSGTMGTAIAELAYAHGYDVSLKGRDQSRVDESVEKIKASQARKRERATNTSAHEGKLRGTVNSQDLALCDLIIEASLEDVEVKKAVFQDVLKVVSDKCVLATNTSALSVASTIPPAADASRFIGLHFFQPVDRMQLVEVVSHPQANKDAVSAASTFVAGLGKIPLSVKDTPGFLANRILGTYLEEVARFTQENVPLNWIDEAALAFGMPIAPFELLDEIGWYLVIAIADALHAGLGERMTPPPKMYDSVKAGLRSKRDGIGIFVWDESGRKKGYNPDLERNFKVVISPDKVSPEKCLELQERLILPMIDEAARCLEEKIVLRAREVDVATVFGLGFPPFRGGLLRYADKVGLPYVRDRLQEIYASTFGKRSVSQYIHKLVAEDRGFYGRVGADES
ncbi:MAG: enoyl-CoA hydratase/isomerase family protein [Candidatus Obscuribacterales bacterium]|nr:enoyl-CoA hydratase/isomerase family protein [Candidatus Obscuribacterales bacterium]